MRLTAGGAFVHEDGINSVQIDDAHEWAVSVSEMH
jgi:hypothetical protein